MDLGGIFNVKINRMKNCIYRTIIILFALFLTTCSDDINSEKIKTIKYGTSFGMCVGYCKHEMIVNSKKIIFNSSGSRENVITKTKSESIKNSTWETLNSGIELKSFFELPVTIGCPDCADGGAEWLEIELENGDTHKVVFEYYIEPELLKKVIEEFRGLMTENEVVK